MRFRGERNAFGSPGIEPRWTHGNKEGVGTSPFRDSTVWFSLWRGVLTEVYYPLVDHPQVRDLQYLVSDGRTFFHEEKRHLTARTERGGGHALSYQVSSSDPEGRYRIEKEVIADPHLPVILERTRFRRGAGGPADLALYVLCAPHLDVAGWGNNAFVVELAGRELLVAERNGTWLALGATVPFRRLSCGYVGASDGWTDLAANFQMDYEFDRAVDGNVALTGELDLDSSREFTLGLAFGQGLASAVAALLQSLGIPFQDHLKAYRTGWEGLFQNVRPDGRHASDGGNLWNASLSIVRAHEDKTFLGARIASLSVPWGQARSDDDRGGYHLVWTRDLVQSAAGLLAAGDAEAPLRTLIYLATSQQPDGGFPQNYWLNGEPYWTGIQLDEVSFAILLAGLLRRERALCDFDPWPMVRSATRYLLEHGPATQQERWEEAAGYSPSTLASNVAALTVAAVFARERGDEATARYVEQYADYLNEHIESWTVTTAGTLIPGISRHYVRVRPADPLDSYVDGPANEGTVAIPNHPAEEASSFPVPEVVDAGFLELVRFGVRPAIDPLVQRSLEVVDRVLKVDTPYGPCWHRYNHDGYGQRDDGGPFLTWGTGRAWPILTGERAHYELARGADARPYVRALERFASPTGLLPEQVWDRADRPDLHLWLGRPTTSAMPLVWAHAEYLKLLRSIADGRVFDRIPEVERRYSGSAYLPSHLEFWKPHHRPTHRAPGQTLRIQATEPFRLHWSSDGWHSASDSDSTETPLGLSYVDLPPGRPGGSTVFTFYWTLRSAWGGQNFTIGEDAAGSGLA